MIEIKNLTKIFKSKSKEKCVALDDVSFTLPDNGLVFVIGKSGSGKTTLLSLLGTLDSVTSGDIIVDGLSIVNLKESEASSYRNDTIGFIYQDYHLLEDLTIRENIELSLDLKHEDISQKISDVLKKVGLEGYENRYPKELSGGEKQRVAIARAMIKNPKIILADEPTGNLDTNTSKQIFDLLKEYSKDHLVLIVSHDLLSSKEYADMLINLSYGKVLGIYERNLDSPSKLVVKDDTLYLPSNKTFTDEDSEYLESNIKNIKRVVAVNDNFKESSNKIESKNEKLELVKKHLSFKDSFKIGSKFIKHKSVFSIVFIVIITCLINVFGLTYHFSNFDSKEFLIDKMDENNQSAFVLKKDFDEEEEEVNSLYATKVFSDEEISTIKNNNLGMTVKVSCGREGYPFNPKTLYQENPRMDIICCGEEKDKFLEYMGFTGKYIAEMNFSPNKCGVYISDLLADTLLYRYPDKFESYEYLLGFIGRQFSFDHYLFVQGIFETNYKERYKKYIDLYKDNVMDDDTFNDKKKDFEFAKFLDDVEKFYLCPLYFGGADYGGDEASYRQNYMYADISNSVMPGYSYIVDNGKKIDGSLRFKKVAPASRLSDGDCLIHQKLYQRLTGKVISQSNVDRLFVPIKIDVEVHDFYESYKNVKAKEPLYKTTLNVQGLTFNGYENDISVVYSTFNQFVYRAISPIALYSFNKENTLKALNSPIIKDGLYIDSTINRSMENVAISVESFRDLFRMLLWIILTAILILLIVVSLRSVKEQVHNIGVLKSLGVRFTDLSLIFSFKALLIAIGIALLYGATAYGFIVLANKILLDSISRYNSSLLFCGFNIIEFDIINLFINIAIVILTAIVSFLVELIKLKRIKPINIIKAKE